MDSRSWKIQFMRILSVSLSIEFFLIMSIFNVKLMVVKIIDLIKLDY